VRNIGRERKAHLLNPLKRENMNFRKLRADEIECRVGTEKKNPDGSVKGCSILLYKDARCDMRLLDEVVGQMNWKREHRSIDGRLYCTVSIYDKERGEWVSKEDVGVESRTEAEKGQASDAFKRACFNWGIGRELYTAPFIWISGKAPNGLHCSLIGYDDTGNISQLVLCDSNGRSVYTYGQRKQPQAVVPTQDLQEQINAVSKMDELMNLFVAYRQLAESDPSVKAMFTRRKEELK
jgi:hypothetical protein